MEQIENQGTQSPEVPANDSTTDASTQTETLEANQTGNENDSTTEGDGSQNSGRSLNDKLAELGLTRDEYFKLKGQEGSQESGESREESGQEKPVASESDRLARIELKAEGITDVDDIDAVMEAAKGLGVSPTEALEKPFVKAMLESNAKARETQDATPGSQNRSGQTSVKDSAEYWVKKGELPPKENKTLRREVMHRLNEAKTRSRMFNN